MSYQVPLYSWCKGYRSSLSHERVRQVDLCSRTCIRRLPTRASLRRKACKNVPICCPKLNEYINCNPVFITTRLCQQLTLLIHNLDQVEQLGLSGTEGLTAGNLFYLLRSSPCLRSFVRPRLGPSCLEQADLHHPRTDPPTITTLTGSPFDIGIPTRAYFA